MKMPNRTPNSEKSLIDPTKAKQVISRGKMEEEKEIKQISLKLSAELLSRCDAACELASISRSAFIKMAILEKLERDGR